MSPLGPGPEFDLIRSIVGRPRTHPLIMVGPGDDCAVIGELAISTDVSVEDVHFRTAWLSDEEIGYRAAAAALSDLAAVGADIVGVLASLVAADGGRAKSVMAGITNALESLNGVLIGGDVSRGDRLMIDVVAVGKVNAPLLRSHARAGDEIWVTGVLGGSAAAVAMLEANADVNAAARARYAHPAPRIREMLWLRRHLEIGAAIDISDGLFGDLAHIAAASNCGILIDAGDVPVDQAAAATYEQAVRGGEDYEVAFTAAGGSVDEIRQDFVSRFGVELTRIGEVQRGSGVQERMKDGKVHEVHVAGYQHFDG